MPLGGAPVQDIRALVPPECHRDKCETVVGIGNAGCKFRCLGNHLFRILDSPELQQHRGQETMRGKTDRRAGDSTLSESKSLFEAAGLHQVAGVTRRYRSGAVHVVVRA